MNFARARAKVAEVAEVAEVEESWEPQGEACDGRCRVHFSGFRGRSSDCIEHHFQNPQCSLTWWAGPRHVTVTSLKHPKAGLSVDHPGDMREKTSLASHWRTTDQPAKPFSGDGPSQSSRWTGGSRQPGQKTETPKTGETCH